nr:uncharacterized protein LOC123002449 [Drosophila takahashii]
MYRQVEVDEAQRIFQLIVWRRDAASPLKTYRLNTVTYGTASAPFLAVQDVSGTDFYVDDLLTGADTEQGMAVLRRELIEILEPAGFVLTKWASNCKTGTSDKSNAEILQGDRQDLKTLGR